MSEVLGRSRKGTASQRRNRSVRRREFLLDRREQWLRLMRRHYVDELEDLAIQMWELDLINPLTETLQQAMRDVKGFIGILMQERNA